MRIIYYKTIYVNAQAITMSLGYLLYLFIVSGTVYFLREKQMNYHHPISSVSENALNFTFETKIRITRFILEKT